MHRRLKFIILFFIFLLFNGCANSNEKDYNDAIAFIKDGNYNAAEEKLVNIEGYENAEKLLEEIKYETLLFNNIDNFLINECYDISTLEINEIKIYNVTSGKAFNTKVALCLMNNVLLKDDLRYIAINIENSDYLGSYCSTPYQYSQMEKVSMDDDVANGSGWYNITHIYWDTSRSTEVGSVNHDRFEMNIKKHYGYKNSSSEKTNNNIIDHDVFQQGFYYIPDDLEIGTYDVYLLEGYAIVISISNNGEYNTSMCLSNDSTSFSNLTLNDGAKIEISGGGKVQFNKK